MSDITSIWNAQTQHCDYMISKGAFASGLDVQTAVLLSIFTDRLANMDDVIPDAPLGAPGDRRGWWGDDPSNLMGSRLWLLSRVKGPMDVTSKAQDYATEAVQWMLDDGIVANFDIDATWTPPNQLDLLIVAYRSDGTVISNQPLSLW